MAFFGSGADQQLNITIKAKDEASQTLKKVESQVGIVAKGVAAGTVAVAGITSAFRVMGGVVAGSIREFDEQSAVLAQLNAVLKSTNYAAGLTSSELVKMADAMARVTLYEDDAIVSTQAMLLTFTNITRDTFPAATQAVLDMSTALGQDLKSSAIQLGKALNNPIEGVSALQRVGVNFNNAQQEMIETLVKSGRTIDAQNFILRELQKEFGGSAESAYQAASDITKLQKSLVEIQEQMGSGVVPAMNNFISGLREASAGMGGAVDIGKVTFITLSKVGEAALATATGIHAIAAAAVIATAEVGQFLTRITGLSTLLKVFGVDSNKAIDAFQSAAGEGVKRTASLYDMVKSKNNEVKRTWGEQTDAARIFGKVAPAAYQATKQEADAAAKKMKEALKVLEDTGRKLEDLKKAAADDDTKRARAFAEQENKVNALRKDLANETDPERQEELRRELNRESAALETARPLFRGAQSAVLDTARKYTNATDFERTLGDLDRGAIERVQTTGAQIMIDLRGSTIASGEGVRLLVAELQKYIDRETTKRSVAGV